MSSSSGDNHVLLVLNGEPPRPEDLAAAGPPRIVICADGGLHHALSLQLKVDAVVGDLDSVDSSDIPPTVQVIQFPRAKDDTDGELALAHALGLGPTRLSIVGGHGGRTAMFLANLKLLRRAREADVAACMYGGREVIQMLGPGDTAPVGEVGGGVDVLAVGGPARVTLTGCAWTLAREWLQQTEARGVSNQVTEESAAITVHEGHVILVRRTG